jgi:hypothetical protein
MGWETSENTVYRDSPHIASSILKCGYCNAPFAFRKKKVLRKNKEEYIFQYTLPKHYRNDCPKIIRNLDADVINSIFMLFYFFAFMVDENVSILSELEGFPEDYEAFTYRNEKINEFKKSNDMQKRQLVFNIFEGLLLKKPGDKNYLQVKYQHIPLLIEVDLRRNSHSRKQKRYRFDIYQDSYSLGTITTNYKMISGGLPSIETQSKELEGQVSELIQHIMDII